MKKHFKLTSETKVNRFGVKLYRIEALIDFEHAKAGDRGGWVEKEDNLTGRAWITDEAEAFNDAVVAGNALMLGSSMAYDKAEVSGNARMLGDSRALKWARVRNGSRLYGGMQASRKVVYSDHIWPLTLSDNHITYGCAAKTISEWVEWLDSDEVIQTPRWSKKFKLIEMALRLAIEQHKQRQ